MSPGFAGGFAVCSLLGAWGVGMRSAPNPLWGLGPMVPLQGIEPWTSALPRMRSTSELQRRKGEGGL